MIITSGRIFHVITRHVIRKLSQSVAHTFRLEKEEEEEELLVTDSLSKETTFPINELNIKTIHPLHGTPYITL